MLLTDFETDYRHLRELVDKILISKRKEYADGGKDGDRLSNFKAACSTFRTNPAMICLYYASKHWEACAKIAQDIDKGIYPSQELLDEKCQDISAYMALFHACVMEMLETPSETRVEASNSDDKAKDDFCTLKNESQTFTVYDDVNSAYNATD